MAKQDIFDDNDVESVGCISGLFTIRPDMVNKLISDLPLDPATTEVAHVINYGGSHVIYLSVGHDGSHPADHPSQGVSVFLMSSDEAAVLGKLLMMASKKAKEDERRMFKK